MYYVILNYFHLKHLAMNSKHLLQLPTEKNTHVLNIHVDMPDLSLQKLLL